MTINKSSRWKRLRALAVVPVIALALLAFANPRIDAAAIVADEQPTVAPSSQSEEAPVMVENTVDEPAPAVPEQKSEIYETVEQLPEFPGGQQAMIEFLSSNVRYPEKAAKNNIQGRVLVRFVVEKTGEISNIEVVRSVDEELDAEAIRVIKSMPNFTPGRQDGKPVAVWYTLPLIFKLNESKTK